MSHLSNFAVFARIDEERIERIFETVNESIMRKPLTKQMLDKITGHDLTNEDIDAINDKCVTFAMTANPDRLVTEIDKATISKDKQNTLKKCLISLKKRLPRETIKRELKIIRLHDFGHPHISHLEITSEFRPISTSENEIIKIVQSIVFSGTLHNAGDHTNKIPINFQLDLEGTKMLVDDIQHVITHAENEARVFRDKFGDDIIDV